MTVRSQKSEDGRRTPGIGVPGKAFPLNDMYLLLRNPRKDREYAPGRGSHGLKHNFAQERYLECIKHGMTHEQTLQQTSLETSHFRLRETLTYTRG